MFVTIETGRAIRAGLDTLEARGRSHLAALGRCEALATATSVMARASVIVPLLGLCMAFVQPVPVVVLILVGIGVPLLAGIGVFAVRRKVVVNRDVALALFDRGEGFKDRVTVSDEFLDRADGGGFHAAAVAEAAPWITRALDLPLAGPEVRRVIRHTLRQQANYLVCAVVVLVLAMLLGRPVGSNLPRSVEMRGEAAPEVRVDGDVGPVRSDVQEATVATMIAATLGARLGLVDALAGRAGEGGNVPPSGDATSGAKQPGPGAAAGDAAGTANAGASKAAGGGQGATGGGGGGAGGAGGGAAGRDGGGGTPGGNQISIGERAVSTAGMPRQQNGESGAETQASASGEVRTDTGSRRAERPRPPGTEPGQASSNAPGSANPADTRRSSSPQADQGDRQRSTPGRPGEGGEGQDQAQGNKPGQASNRSGTAQESIKRSRGLSSLLLAVPTVDRLTGTPDAGASRSTLRRVSPQAREAVAVLAGDRGVQGGDAGIVAQRAATPHDARLVRDYFNRGGGERR